MRVLVYGASITQGLWDTEGGWVSRMRKHYDSLQIKDLQRSNCPTIFNLGVSGDTVQNVLDRFEAETRARTWSGDELAFIFSVGTNDSIVQRDTSLAEYRKTLEELIGTARRYSSKILCVGLPPCDEKLTNPVSWNPQVNYTNERIKATESEMGNLCGQEEMAFVPLFDYFRDVSDEKHSLLADGLHPNNEGHQIIFDRALPVFEKMIGI